MAFKRVTQPTKELLSLSEAKSWLGVTSNNDDPLIQDQISEARDIVERTLNQCLAKSQWRLTLDTFPDINSWYAAPTAFPALYPKRQVIRLPRPPLVSVESIQYLSNGSYTTLPPSEYTVDAQQVPGIVYPHPKKQWPSCDREPNAIVILFTAGYDGSLNEYPIARSMMRQTLWWLYNNRGVFNDSQLDEFMERLRGLGDYLPCI